MVEQSTPYLWREEEKCLSAIQLNYTVNELKSVFFTCAYISTCHKHFICIFKLKVV